MLYDQKNQNTAVNPDVFLKQREYWLKQLSGEQTGRSFPVSVNARGKTTGTFEMLTFPIPDELFPALVKISKGANPKLFMIMLSALVVLLGRYTGSSDIMIGAPIYKQQGEGDFINTVLPLKNRLSGSMTFKELLIQVRENFLQAVENQNYPIKNLLNDLELPFYHLGLPLFETAILMKNLHDKKYLQPIQPNVIFSFTRTEADLKGELEYNPLMYEKGMMERLITHFNCLLAEAFDDLDAPISCLNLLPAGEKEQLLVDFNNTQAPFPTDNTLQELFALQADKVPDQVALYCNGKELSYKELNQKARQWAQLLKEKGVKPDTLIGIMVESSLEMVVGILAILKAGAAYLPIDTHYPHQRIRYMLADSNISLLLTRWHLQEKPGPGIEIIDVGDETLTSYPPDSLHRGDIWGDSAHLAYVIYTSGSTGKPNGVSVEHRNILNYISWRINRYCQGAADVSMQLVSVSFDGFAANLFPSLLSGGKTILINENRRGDIDFLRTLIREQKVTNFSVVPSFYRLLLDKASKENFASVRFVVLGGEKAWPGLIEESMALMPQAQLVNEYGPTENSVTTTAHTGITPDSVSIIGTPIANNQIFILDHDQNLQPIGVMGELSVTGAGLSRGYLNRPELTAERFVMISRFHRSYLSYLSSNTYIKLYKTGDLARWLPDGKIEISGRMDSQVKVRGVRIEVSEIENQLIKLAEINQVVVMAREGHGEDKFLCAYLETDGELDLSTIKNHLSLNLPDYMIPTYFIRLEEIPLTPNGKLDREKLSQMNDYMMNETEYSEPVTETQKKLAGLWTQHLELENIGIKENYFNIGGDSIKSIKLLQIINQRFGTHLEIIDLYENETIEKLASKLDSTLHIGVGIEKKNDHRSDQGHGDVLREMAELKNRIIRAKREKEQ